MPDHFINVRNMYFLTLTNNFNFSMSRGIMNEKQ